ncbi:ATP-binding protein [Actinokineospora fastidiosa]|uniref:ATP-binding protein n=1 Tax=Actinokineospora fastidiosa TaxID=1816 RepID=A0A918LAR3_9PSEU|nr:ATP-binding protein [Actinokineospora fastidiosa]
MKIGQSVAKQLALHWFAERKADSRRGRDLTRLIRARFPVRRQERDVLDSLLRIEDDVAERLAPELARLGHGLPENEREAALLAVSDALEDADLSDAALFAVDLDAGALARAVREQQPVDRAGLSARAQRFSDAALDRACIVLVHLTRELPEFDAAVAVETLGRLRTVLEGVEELLERVPAPSAPRGQALDDEFRSRYLDRVVRSYNKLDVIGLTTHSFQPRTTLSVAYLSLSATTDNKRPRRAQYEERWFHRDTVQHHPGENLRVEAALDDSRLTVVRGEAGAGKSTLLRWLAVNAARSGFTGQLQEWNECVPFLVKLRDFSTDRLPRGDELLDQPSSPQCGPVPEGWVHRQFESGKALLLVDGVDELVAKRRPAVRAWLGELLASYPDVRVVVTSRPTAVTPKWLVHEGFRSIVLEPMTPGDVRIFLRRWHSALLDSAPDAELLPCRREEVPQYERALLSQLQTHAHLRALARSPLLCAMLCALNLDRRSRLPRDRVALYSAALEMLLERRDADRSVVGEIQASVNEKLELLQVLAWWLNENGRAEMSREQALARLAERLPGMPNLQDDAETLLVHLVERSGVIRQPAEGRIDFIHRTFQEYLAAREAVHRDSIDLLVRHASSDLWRETVIMACAQGSAEQRGRLLAGIIDAADKRKARQLVLVAAACKETAILAPPEVLARVTDRVQRVIPPRNVRESRSLAAVGESVLAYLPDTVSELTAAQAAACARTAALVNGPRAIEVLRGYADDPRPEVLAELVRAWQYFDPESYARQVLADAPLAEHRAEVPIGAVPQLHLLRNLRKCIVNLWMDDDAAGSVCSLSGLTRLTDLWLVGKSAPKSLAELVSLQNLKTLWISMFRDWPSELPFLAELPRLRYFGLAESHGVEDFSFLRALSNLRALWITHSGWSRWVDQVAEPEKIDATALALLSGSRELARATERFGNLSDLALQDAEALSDLRPLRALPLEELSLDHCGYVDLRGLAAHPTLRAISIDGRSKIDLTPLADMNVTVTLHGPDSAVGVENLGPGVRVRRVRR